MSSAMEYEYRQMESGAWAEVNPSKCPCRGNGWLLSDLDTWHKCPLHSAGCSHPDAEELDGEAPETTSEAADDARRLTLYRNAYATFQTRFVKLGAGTAAQFTKAVKARALAPTPEELTNAAELVAGEYEQDHAEEIARRRGFSCALEMSLAGEAMWERKERALYG
jgi:hypothetical protein